jgi:hypothetical protein
VLCRVVIHRSIALLCKTHLQRRRFDPLEMHGRYLFLREIPPPSKKSEPGSYRQHSRISEFWR